MLETIIWCKREINIGKRLWKENKAKLQKQKLSTHTSYQKNAKISTQFSIIVLNISGLEFLIKRYILVEWIKKQNISFCCLKETQI